MKRLAPLLLLLLAAWHSVDFPYERGEPPRVLESWSGIGVEVVYAPYDALAKVEVYAYTVENGGACSITMPYRWEMAVDDWDRLFAHELRHCTGQKHRYVNIDGHAANMWLP